MKLFLLVAGIAMVSVSPWAMAIEAGYYGVIDAGQSTASKACDTSGHTYKYGPITNFSCADKATSYGASIGYQFNDNLAVEGGYIRVGKFEYSFNTTSSLISSSDEFSQLRFALIGYLPSASSFSVFGKAGFSRGSRTGSGSDIFGSSFQISDDGAGLLAGFGVKYDVSQSLAVRAQLETQGIGGDLKRFDMLSVGLIFQQ